MDAKEDDEMQAEPSKSELESTKQNAAERYLNIGIIYNLSVNHFVRCQIGSL